MGPDGRYAITAGLVAHNRRQFEPQADRRGRIAYVESYDGTANLMVVDRRLGWPRQVSTYPRVRPAGSYSGGFFCWSADGTSLAYVGEDHQLWLVPDVGGQAERLTDLPGACSAPALAPDLTEIAFVYQTDERTDVVVGPIGEPLHESNLVTLNRSDFGFDPVWSRRALLAWHEWDRPSMPWNLGRIVVGRSDGTEAVVVAQGPGVGQPRFSPSGDQLAYLSEASGWLNIQIASVTGWDSEPLLSEAAEHGLPQWHPRVSTFAWSPDGREMVVARNDRGRQTLDVIEVDSGNRQGLDLQAAAIDYVDWGREVVAVASASDRPWAVVAANHRAELIADDGLATWAAADLVAAEAVEMESEDVVIHGMSWKPQVTPAPMILFCHGGPNGQVRDAWNPVAQYWVERGYLMLAVNYRGSTGYGAEYRDALNGRWGELDVADGAAAVRWAVKSGLARPDQVVAMGGSAGGYMVLMLLALHGELFAGGIDFFGVSDLERLAEITHRFEAHYLDTLVGILPDAKDVYRERSPIELTDRITMPLLMFQGDQDVAVPLAQSQTIHDELQRRGVDVELVVYPGEGHGFQSVANVVDSHRRAAAFLRRIGVAPDL